MAPLTANQLTVAVVCAMADEESPVGVPQVTGFEVVVNDAVELYALEPEAQTD